jgi:outer membrane protein TolC
MRKIRKKTAVAFVAGVAFAYSLGAEPLSLSPEEAVRAAQASDVRVESATWDWLSAQAGARDASYRRLPSLSLSAGYTRLSNLQEALSVDVPPLGNFSMMLPSLDNEYALSANLQYPVFAGFRLRETARLAQVQAQSKAVALEMVKRSLVFEAQRAYWEALRASSNVGLLRESLALAAQSRDIIQHQFATGTAMRVDLLSAQMLYDQATIELDAAVGGEKRAFWTLAWLIQGTRMEPSAASAIDPETSFNLTVSPEPVPDSRFPTLDEAQLIATALANRPEIRASNLNSAAAEASRAIAEAPLYPTLTLAGGYVYADPNPRAVFQTDPWLFTGTWSMGLSLSYDIGGLPANLAAREEQIDLLAKTRAEEKSTQETVILDVQNCLLAFCQARKEYELLSATIEQAKENERVIAQKASVGSASDIDVLSARTARLKVEFTVTNKLIDEQIAAADLKRAVALAIIP